MHNLYLSRCESEASQRRSTRTDIRFHPHSTPLQWIDHSVSGPYTDRVEWKQLAPACMNRSYRVIRSGVAWVCVDQSVTWKTSNNKVNTLSRSNLVPSIFSMTSTLHILGFMCSLSMNISWNSSCSWRSKAIRSAVSVKLNAQRTKHRGLASPPNPALMYSDPISITICLAVLEMDIFNCHTVT